MAGPRDRNSGRESIQGRHALTGTRASKRDRHRGSEEQPVSAHLPSFLDMVGGGECEEQEAVSATESDPVIDLGFCDCN